MNSCKNCTNAIFDEVWGEYKCKVHEHRIRDVDKYLDCPKHESNKKEENKNA